MALASNSPPFNPVARLVRVALACELSAEQVLLAVRDEPWPFALSGNWAGGGAIVGARPLRLASESDDPFALLEQLPALNHDGHRDADESAVGGGWFGWLGYGLGRRIERLPEPPARPVPIPAFHMAYYDHVLRQDRRGRWWFEALVTPGHEAALEARLAWLQGRLRYPPEPPPRQLTPPPFRVVDPRADGHVAAVRECRERISAGEIFQANLCLRLETSWVGDVTRLYARAAPRLRPAYGGVFPAPWGGIVSFSPELFLRRRGRTIITRPIKGTIRRQDDAERADAALRTLRGSLKDHAEHVMIVDLMRNDLGRVCVYGTIDANLTPDAESHPGVWHLVSSVTGVLRQDVGDGQLLRATFPPGSVTGAPKVQAMRVIAELEPTARELYTGAVGLASPVAGLEFNVAIRTFEACDGRLWLGAGGGIVAESNPRHELEECLLKARPLLAAIDSSLAGDRPISLAMASPNVRRRSS